MMKSRRTASFLTLFSSKIEKSRRIALFWVVKFKNEGSLAELFRF